MSTLKSSAEDLTLNADGSGNDIRFQSNGVEKASINQDGLFTSKSLVVNGTNADLSFSSSGNNITFARNGDNYITANGGGSSNLTLDGQSRIVLKHNGTEKLRVTSSGLTFNGDTAAANALDDYEEGTWDPELRGTTGSAGSWAESTWTANYTRIGRLVHINAAGILTNVGSWSGNTILRGLPFTNAGGSTALTLCHFPDNLGSADVAAQVYSGVTDIYFFTGAKMDVFHSYADINVNYYCNVSGTYIAD